MISKKTTRHQRVFTNWETFEFQWNFLETLLRGERWSKRFVRRAARKIESIVAAADDRREELNTKPCM